MLTEQGSRPDWTPWNLADPYDPTGIFCLLNVSSRTVPQERQAGSVTLTSFPWPYCSSRECGIMWF
jgi:hypothetical protein